MVRNWSKVIPRVIPIFSCSCKSLKNKADVAELADAHDLGSCGVTRGGSSPLIRTNKDGGFRGTYKNSTSEISDRTTIEQFVGI